MKVHELITLLSTLDPNVEVVQSIDPCFAPITGVSPVKGNFRLIEHPDYRPGGAYEEEGHVEYLKRDGEVVVKSDPLTLVCLVPME